MSCLAFPAICRAELPSDLVDERQFHVELRHETQIVRLTPIANGEAKISFLTTTSKGIQEIFRTNVSCWRGTNFKADAIPPRIERYDPERGLLEIHGTAHDGDTPWSLTISAQSGVLPIRFDIKWELSRAVTLSGNEPALLLDMLERPQEMMRIDQGSGNIYFGNAGRQWGNSFPAAYLWADGVETVFFVDGGSLNWTGPRNLFRFRDFRAQTVIKGKSAALGLNVVKRNFHELPAGPITATFYLYAAPGKKPNNRLEGLGRLISLCAPLHPAQAAQPLNRKTGEPARWRDVATGVAKDLSLEEVCRGELAFADNPWRDEPLFTDRKISSLPVSPDYAINSACPGFRNRTNTNTSWDFSTCNNYLSGWLAWLQIFPQRDQLALVTRKAHALPLFFDPQTRQIRHSTRHLKQFGPWSMCWQNFMFHLEMFRVHRMMPSSEFDPAIGGRCLMSLQALIELAHHENYVFPQWYDPARGRATTQKDVPELGVVREPWQVGSYAWVMCQAHRITGDSRYLEEASSAVKSLFAPMKFRVKNQRYDVTYEDPADYPITEVFGNAWGAPACQYLYEATRDVRYQRWGRDFCHVLLTMTYWYESHLANDPRDQTLGNLGLFRNHGGAFTGSPWENCEVYLALTEYLRRCERIDPLILKLLNVYRHNSFHFHALSGSDDLLPCRKFAEHPAEYLPVEDYPMLEQGTGYGQMGRCIYMSGIAFWNYLLFEAFAEADDAEVLALNLSTVDGFRAALDGARRELLLFNSAEQSRRVLLLSHNLPPGTYTVRSGLGLGAIENAVRSREELTAGIPWELPPRSSLRVILEQRGSESGKDAPENDRQVRDQLATLYANLNQAVGDGEPVGILKEIAAEVEIAVAEYRAGDLALSQRRCQNCQTRLLNLLD
ncbi:hypothetical protein OAS39_01680 [Pirellulales bacterium]|nr:hypothetical protein [Pirellulales bacterium]